MNTRPRRPENDQFLSVCLPLITAEAVRALCESRGETVSAYIRRLLTDDVSRHTPELIA